MGKRDVETHFPDRRERACSHALPPNNLDTDAAGELLAFFGRCAVRKFAGFSLWTWDEMTPEAANVISSRGLDTLFLDSVRVVSLEMIRILAESPVSDLSLGGLEQISLEVATSLSRLRGSVLKRDGLADLSAEIAANLARLPKWLSFGGIKTLSADRAKALARQRGELMLDRLIHLP